ncbi:uncharacterized protein MELLADRAFT_91295 [Melampsora larici-populina 98AG31]|uniref:Alpha-type protein kinase domain-containing protein n=1 Tax=Melampsora larici-populina (strain 98AG31 / pathotype 3-4-7) TaxID=747676 RepID=F4RYI5_MELLP|nr:uncharacterized protein MELLADRAFT_91295 [Melampsora larici-populina 98AG31]EGG02572.1 hypothetical protein MELLADRAFT_91295 [Melampsora larici-populina 98AG31]
MNSHTCSACHLQAPSFRGLCNSCLDIRLGGGSSSPTQPTSASSSSTGSGSPHLLNFNQNHSFPASTHPGPHLPTPQYAYPNAPQPNPALNAFNTQAFKQAAATSKRGRTVPSGTISSRPRGRHNSNTPAYDASSPVITVLCGFETFKASKWAKQRLLSVSRTIDVYQPDAYEDLRLDLWNHFLDVFVPNDIIDRLDPSGFAFTTLGSQDGSLTNNDLQWWFSQNGSINLIYDHSRHEHSLNQKKTDPLKLLAHVTPVPEATSKHPKIGRCNASLSLLYTTADGTVQGVERYGRSTEPSLVYTLRALDWISGLQWTVEDNGNTIDSDFAAYRWNSDIEKTGRTHYVRSIEIWHPDGPMKFISKTAIANHFTLWTAAATNTTRLYTAVQILLQEFVKYAKSIPGLSSHTEMYETINNLRLVEHTIISSETQNEDDEFIRYPDTSEDNESNIDSGGPKDVMFVEEALNTPLDAFSHWTYQESKGQRFVTELRGSGHVVTNPQIHDLNPARNGRAAAVALMTDQHQCRLGCQLLQLPKMVRIHVQPPQVDLIWQHAQKLPNGDKINHGHVDLPTYLSQLVRPVARKPPTPAQILF